MPRLSLRAQLLLALVVPAGVIVVAVAWRAEVVAQCALEDALGHRLRAVASAASTLLGPRVTVLGPGDDATRTKRNALAKLRSLQDATRVSRILVVRAIRDEVLVDTEELLPIGAPYRRAEFDRLELRQVRSGQDAASVLFAGPLGRPQKTGYAPLHVDETVTAYVAVIAPVTYSDELVALRRRVGLVGLSGLLALGVGAILLAGFIARPLARLSEAARAIGEGTMQGDIPDCGPREAEVLASTMRTMSSSLRAREEEMQMMLAGIAHEVRNPLAGIELFGGLLREDLEGDPRRGHIDRILQELGVLSRVVRDFLEFAGTPAHRPSLVNIDELIGPACSLVEGEVRDRNLQLEVVGGAPVRARLDRESMQRALLNLLRNAIQAAPAGGRVGVRVGRADRKLVLVVEDSGPGIPENQRDAVFAPFFTTRQKGTGLGLALVRRTILAHRGRIWVETSELGGARFVVELPDALEAEPTLTKDSSQR